VTFEMPLTVEQQQRAAHSHLEARRRKAAAQAEAVGSPAQPHAAVQNWWEEEDAAWTEALQEMEMPLPAGSALQPGVAAAAGERDEVAALALGQDDDSGRMSQWDASVTEEMMAMAAQVSQAQVGVSPSHPCSRCRAECSEAECHAEPSPPPQVAEPQRHVWVQETPPRRLPPLEEEASWPLRVPDTLEAISSNKTARTPVGTGLPSMATNESAIVSIRRPGPGPTGTPHDPLTPTQYEPEYQM
jgi:hypothetical protein